MTSNLRKLWFQSGNHAAVQLVAAADDHYSIQTYAESFILAGHARRKILEAWQGPVYTHLVFDIIYTLKSA